MGVNAAITHDTYPKQGIFQGKRVEVMFHYDSRRILTGQIVRDDAAGITIIKLDDGRYILGTECQYAIV